MIDTSSWKEFKLEDILQKVDVQRILLKKSECSTIRTDEYNLPARTATTQNHGLSCYVPRDCATVLNKCISVSANGDYCAFWHDSEFTILQDSYALCGNGFELTEKVALFLISCMDRAFSSKYNWNNKSGWEKLRKEVIKLPVTESEEIDWSYMQERIEELEQERIEELEQYLIATGLNDYELTDEEKEILHVAGFGVGSKPIKPMIEFRCGDLFDIHPTRAYKMSNNELYQTTGNMPVLSNSSIDNGIGGYCGLQQTENGKIITFSDTTTGADTMFYQEKPFIGYSHVQGMYPYDVDNWKEYQQRYFISAMRHVCGNGWSYSNKFNRKLVAEMKPLLPIQTDDNNNPIIDNTYTYHPDGYIPDWEFMEKYIKAIEKIVIADVVKYKDDVIKATRSIIE